MIELSTAEYRRLADECRSLAKLAVTIEEKIILWEREASWMKLADETERNSVKTAAKSA
jgi:hypothetical protein